MWNHRFANDNRQACRQMRQLFTIQIEDLLAEAEADRLADHLANCPHCRTWAREEEVLRDRLRAEREPYWTMTPAAAAHNRARIQQRLRRKKLMWQTKQAVQGFVTLLLLVALTAGLFWWWQNNQPALTPDTGPAPAVLPDPPRRQITFAARPHSQSQYEAVMAQFHESHPDIQVQFVPYPTGLGRTLTAQEQAEAADTMFIVTPPDNQVAAYFLPLEPFIAADTTFDTAVFWPEALSGCRSGDILYGLPLLLHFNLLFYDEAAFAVAGLPPPTPGWTWAEFVQAVATLTQAADGETMRYGFADLDSLLAMLESILARSLAVETIALNRLLPFLQDVEGLVAQNQVAVAADPDGSRQELNNLIQNGRAAIWFESPTMLATRRQQLGSQINVVPVPVLANLRQTTPIFTSCAAISTGTAEPEAAWTWLNYLAHHYPPTAEFGGVLAHQAQALSAEDAALEEDTPAGYALRHPWFITNSAAVEALRQVIYEALLAGDDVITAVSDAAPHLTAPAVAPAAPMAPVVVAPPPPTPAPDVQHINFYDFLPALSFYAAPVREFQERHPHIRVTVSAELPGRASTAGFNLTDVAQYYDCFNWPFTLPGLEDYADYTLGDHVISLSPLLDTEPAGFHDDFYPGTISSLTVDGEVMALPLSVQPLVIRYNTRYFADNGLEPPPAQWTATELFNLAAAVAREGDSQTAVYGYTTAFAGRADPLVWFLAEQGRQMWDLSASPPAVYLDDADVAAALRQWLDLAQPTGVYHDTGPGSRSLAAMSDPHRLINNNQMAMWLAQVAWLLNEDPSRPAGIVPLPQIGLSVPPPMLSGLYISRHGSQPDACWQWLKFLTEQPIISPGVPARRSVMNGAVWETAVGRERASVLRLALERHLSQVTAVTGDGPEVGPLNRWLADVLMAAYAGSPVEPLLAEAQQKAEGYLACLATINEPTADRYIVAERCAQQVDPGYLTIRELYEE